MFEIFSEIERFLNVDCGEVSSKNNVKFYRVRRNHHQGDYTSIVWNNHEQLDITCELYDNILKKKRPLWKEFLKFSITDGRLGLFFNRTHCFSNGVKHILESGELYGSNKLNEKIFSVKLDKSFEMNSITYLRGTLVADILRQLIKTSGGIVIENKENEIMKHLNPKYKIVVSTHYRGKPSDDCIPIQVGSVLNGNASILEPTTIEYYYKLRREEIDAMCEYKLEINSVTNNREDLVHATVTFDLIQSNIHKAMTLHMQSQNSDLRTSCKGALFVMYNYVRLVTLIAKFENLVSDEKYLPLPSQDEVNFSLLSQEEEWTLMYDYVLWWPSVVKQSFEHFEEGHPKIHNICRFLIHLASDFSVYYHRTRILIDPRPHLMSVLYARIYFLKVLAQVFKNALNIILLRPLNKM